MVKSFIMEFDYVSCRSNLYCRNRTEKGPPRTSVTSENENQDDSTDQPYDSKLQELPGVFPYPHPVIGANSEYCYRL